jgi:ATP-binding cassette, subfamily F, member 3
MKKWLTNYEKAMSKPNFLENYQKKKKELEQLMKSWEVLQEELEAMS